MLAQNQATAPQTMPTTTVPSASAVQTRPGRPRRNGESLLPREHGVYAEVAFPMITALTLGQASAAGSALTAAIIATFLLHEPMLVLLGRRGLRAKESMQGRARPRVALLATMALTSATTGLWLADEPTRIACAALVLPGLLVAALVVRGREKTFLGEGLVALVLSFTLVPIALAGGVPLPITLGAATVWMVVFALGTATVHSVLARKKRGSNTLAYSVLAVATILMAASTALALGPGPIWAAAVAPAALVGIVVLAVGVTPKHLRRMGWSMVISNAATLAILLSVASTGPQ